MKEVRVKISFDEGRDLIAFLVCRDIYINPTERILQRICNIMKQYTPI